MEKLQVPLDIFMQLLPASNPGEMDNPLSFISMIRQQLSDGLCQYN
jgi:hypothetical protein